MVAINSTGFDPDIHVATPLDAIARVRSKHLPGFLFLTKEGVIWARELMEMRPYFRDAWTIESEH